MSNKKQYINEALVRNGNEIFRVGDVVADSMKLHHANKRPPLLSLIDLETFEIVGIFALDIPYTGPAGTDKIRTELWADLKVAASPYGRSIGDVIADHAGKYSRVEGKRKFADYVAERDQREQQLKDAGHFAKNVMTRKRYGHRKEEAVQRLSDVLSDN